MHVALKHLLLNCVLNAVATIFSPKKINCSPKLVGVNCKYKTTRRRRKLPTNYTSLTGISSPKVPCLLCLYKLNFKHTFSSHFLKFSTLDCYYLCCFSFQMFVIIYPNDYFRTQKNLSQFKWECKKSLSTIKYIRISEIFSNEKMQLVLGHYHRGRSFSQVATYIALHVSRKTAHQPTSLSCTLNKKNSFNHTKKVLEKEQFQFRS